MWNPSAANAQNAGLEARCYSFSMGVAATGDGESVYFTTYDGQSGIPLHDEANGYWYLSMEVKPSSLGSSTYLTDYLAASSSGIYEYGAINTSISNQDLNNNGFPDFLEKSQSTGTTFSGQTTPHWNGYGIYLNSTVTGTLNRSANNVIGSYSGYFQNSQRSSSISGTWELLSGSGSVVYATDTLSMDIQIIIASPDETTNFSGKAAYTCSGEDQIVINSFTLQNLSGGDDVTVYSSVLQRSGKYYRGNVQVNDGNSATSWRDYYGWQLEIYDTNDSDNDGIPDLSDTVDNTKYTITASVADSNGSVSPAVITLEKGQSQTFIAYPNRGYKVKEWKANGSVVQEGGTSYTLTNIQGDTTIIVSFCRQVSIAPWLPLLLDD